LNHKQFYHVHYKNIEPAKKQRKILHAKSKAKNDKITQNEGKTYKTGGF